MKQNGFENSFRNSHLKKVRLCADFTVISYCFYMKTKAQYALLWAILPRSFLSGVLNYTVFPCIVTLGSTCWVLWALLSFFKIFVIVNLGEANLLRCLCFWPCFFRASPSLGQRSSFNTDPSLAQGRVSPHLLLRASAGTRVAWAASQFIRKLGETQWYPQNGGSTSAIEWWQIRWCIGTYFPHNF